jgi:hypothetical protein
MAQVQTIIGVNKGPRDRVTVLFRGILVFPALVFLSSFTDGWGNNRDTFLASSLIVAPAFLGILVRRHYPSYLLTFNHALLELSARVFAYFFLLTDEYPSIEANPNVAVILPDIEGGKNLNQFAPLYKWFLAIPLYIVGFIYSIYALIVTFFAWFATVATDKYPEWAAGPVLGTMQYWNRVIGYAFLLVTDDYPTFSLNA